MGATASSRHIELEPLDESCLTEEERSLSPLFCEILVVVWQHKKLLGGQKHFPDRPTLRHKVKKEEFCSGYTDFEYVYMTVLGLAKLHSLVEEITKLNNGEGFTRNPGVQLLERACGMTMHGDREGANAMLRSAPTALLEAFQAAKASGRFLDFFRQAFDRQADPCLEGRTSRLLHFLESHRLTSTSAAPWEDVSLRPLAADAAIKDVAGEHLRVFGNECTWQWSRQREMSYEEAQRARFSGDDAAAEDFARLFNAESFSRAMRARGVVRRRAAARWEAQVEDGSWSPYDDEASAAIEAAHLAGQPRLELRLGPRGWTYVIDLANQVQLNPKTRKSRPIRRSEAVASPVSPEAAAAGARLTEEELAETIRFFVDMQTLPPAPPPPPPPTMSEHATGHRSL
ncbi:unnamed protein product [Effrenium voratum]|nr:unnamed protein product [Effrenium voratum]